MTPLLSPKYSASIEDYLKAIYALRTSRRHATTGAIAERLGVSAPAVSAMVKRLEANGLVLRRPRREVELSAEGETLALSVVRRHRLLETFLHRTLGMPWDEVHDEAERLEHALSERVEDLIASHLGYPTHDPHGDPIPPKNGHHEEDWTEPLESLPVGTAAVVDRVVDDAELLRHLAGLHLGPGAEVVVKASDPFGGPVWVSVAGDVHPLGRELARAVFVTRRLG